MLKKICIFTALSASLLFGSANATSGGRSAGFAELGNSSVGNGIFEYDAANGWWWYKERSRNKNKEDQQRKA